MSRFYNIIVNDFLHKSFADHKRRMDRGGTYWGYMGMLFQGATFLGVYKLNTWWSIILGIIVILIFRYGSGYVDEKKVLSKEQSGYNQQSPEMQQILKDLEFLKSKYN